MWRPLLLPAAQAGHWLGAWWQHPATRRRRRRRKLERCHQAPCWGWSHLARCPWMGTGGCGVGGDVGPLPSGMEEDSGRTQNSQKINGAKPHSLSFSGGRIRLVPGASAPCISERLQPVVGRLRVSVSVKATSQGLSPAGLGDLEVSAFRSANQLTQHGQRHLSLHVILEEEEKRLCKILFGDNS